MIRAILETKKQEMAALKPGGLSARTKPVRPLVFDDEINIIAELKRKSPSAGFIGEITAAGIETYSTYAKAISVLTDGMYFGGTFSLLSEVAGQTHLPILCKDFVIDPVQIDLAYASGADVVLLIARILTKEELEHLYGHAHRLGLACLVELHDARDLEKTAGLKPHIVGVNARNLDTLEMDIGAAASLMPVVDAPVRIAESGIRSRRDIERMSRAGANGFLIGETLMRSENLEATFKELIYG
jgi:indole-3-glycerol phosphate synthase